MAIAIYTKTKYMIYDWCSEQVLLRDVGYRFKITAQSVWELLMSISVDKIEEPSSFYSSC